MDKNKAKVVAELKDHGDQTEVTIRLEGRGDLLLKLLANATASIIRKITDEEEQMQAVTGFTMLLVKNIVKAPDERTEIDLSVIKKTEGFKDFDGGECDG